MAQQYIGSRISLISKSDIRYRGVLHSIDPAASTVSLQQVRSMGTESRKADPSEEIAPTDTVYDFIVFRAADVKDLSIEAPADPKPDPPKPSIPDDPAIMSTTAPPRSVNNPFLQGPMVQASQGIYNHPIQPMIYPPTNVPPQWAPPYVIPNQSGVGFPPNSHPQQPPSQQTITQSSSSSKPLLPPNSQSSNEKLPLPSSRIDHEGSPISQKASSLASSSPTKPNMSTGLSVNRTGSTPLVKNSASLSKTPASALVSNVPPPSSNKSVFGTPTAMEMMASIASAKPLVSSTQTSGLASSSPTKKKDFHHQPHPKHQNPNHSTFKNGNIPISSHPQTQHPMRHPLPQVPMKSKQPSSKPTQPDWNKSSQPTINKTPAPIIPAQDFDFASANAKFTKAVPTKAVSVTNGNTDGKSNGEPVDELTSGIAQTLTMDKSDKDELVIPEAPMGTYYDKKKSFFDDISSEVKERLALSQESSRGGPGPGGRGSRGSGRGGRGAKTWDRNAERQKNFDTFGDVALTPNLGALGSGYNGYGRGGAQRLPPMSGVSNGYRGGMRGGRGYSRGRGGMTRGGGMKSGPGSMSTGMGHTHLN